MSREINAHLVAAERNPVKFAQHLTAATQHAEAQKIPHFGRWSEFSVTARNARRVLRDQEFHARHETSKAPTARDQAARSAPTPAGAARLLLSDQ